jgi:predicted O-linked N-acetylglucosamine transferase (SPINDLY family)
MLRQALAHHQRGQLAEAESLYRAVLAQAPASGQALHMLGLVQFQKGELDAALASIGQAVALDPREAAAHSNLALVLQRLRRHDDALAAAERALALAPDYPEALVNRGNALHGLGRHAEALASYDRALALRPGYAEVFHNRGLTLVALARHAEALASYDRALALHPDNADALVNRGDLLVFLKRHADALRDYDRALALDPGRAEAHCRRANALLELRRDEQAVAGFDRALALKPAYVEALFHRGLALWHLRRADEALACYDRALALDPVDTQVLHMRANVLRELDRPEEASAAFARLLALAPDYPFAKGELLHAKMLACDWDGFDALAAEIRAGLAAGRQVVDPFGYQGIATSERDLQLCATAYAAAHFPPAPAAHWNGERYANPRIRIGYVSGEFRHQATSILMTELFERHDHGRFELYAFDNGWDDGSDIRRRIVRAFDEVVAVARLGDDEAAAAVRARRIDILVNLNGYFGLARQGIFSRRPSPVQVNYLGFPGTIGADYIDYIVADRHVIPPGHDAFYTEKVVRLPDTYQVNDSQRRIAAGTPTRAEAGLPDAGVVFCCFNNTYKITPDVFAAWTRLLQGVPGSVLWLLETNGPAARNLRREAQRRGVAAERVVFAPRAPLDAHLARHRLADLFLDTLPYNAHTTASDALWAGLPVVTCTGTTFPGRVATSLLEAIGLPELVTKSLVEYEALALRLARDPAELAALRAKLARHRTGWPLFDTDRFRRHLEAAYVAMWERCQRGEPPASFAVPPIG